MTIHTCPKIVRVLLPGIPGPPGSDRFTPIGTLADFGAVGDGVTNDKAAITAAFASGKWLTGNGLTYGVSGNLTIPTTGLHLQDATFRQLTPSASVRTLARTSADGPTTGPVKLVRVRVDRGTDHTVETITDAAGMWLYGISGLWLEDCEVWGGGAGVGIFPISCDHVTMIRPYVHDMRWSKTSGAVPTSEQITAIWPTACRYVRIYDPRIERLDSLIPWYSGQVIDAVSIGQQKRYYGANGYVAASSGTTGGNPPIHNSGTVSDGGVSWTYIGAAGAAARSYQADGLDFSGCEHVQVHGGELSAWEGVDISGSALNRDIWFHGTKALDCDAYGFKVAHRLYDGGFVGCQSVRSGLGGFVVAGAVDAADGAHNVLFDTCVAEDTGYQSNWAGFEIIGFSVASLTYPTDIVAINSIAIDRQPTPTMKYGFRREGTAANFRTLYCRSEGHLTAAANFADGLIEALPDGSMKASAFTASSELTALKWMTTRRTGLTLANGLNSNIPVDQSTQTISGPTAPFSIGGFTNGAEGRHLFLHNLSSQDMTIVNESALSTGANRITTLTSADVALVGNCAAHLIYSSATNRWILHGEQGKFVEVVTGGPVTATGELTAMTWFTTRRDALVLVNGLNSNIDVNESNETIGGPTAAFSIGGFLNGAEGRHLWLHNASSQDMTIVNESALSVAANRINTLTGADVVLSGNCAVHLIYSSAVTRWVLHSTNG